jgi:phosphate-selective porin OprO and OprP
MTISKSRLCGGVAAGAFMALALGGVAHAQDTSITWAGAPRIQNDALNFKVRGRIYEDYVFQDVDRAAGADFSASSSRLRTARIGVEGTYGAQWGYKVEINFPGRGETYEWEDVMLEYKPNDMTSVVVGNFKTVSLENITSSRYITFMERGPFNDLLDIGRVATAMVKVNDVNWTAAASVSGNSFNSSDVANGDERRSVQFRGTFAPIDSDSTKVHLGAWARWRDGGDEAAFNYRVRNNTNFGDRYTATGGIGAKDVTYALEGAVVHGPLSVQAEWAQIQVDRVGAGQDPDLNTFYVFASFFPTGETRRYSASAGEFSRVKINNPTTAGGFGALELAVRYDSADLSDLPVVATAGEYSAWTVGATWYPIPYVRFMANYTKAENDGRTLANDVDVDTLQFRAQFDW